MPKVDNEIVGKLAVVTGASGGIGAACARSLWARGLSLAITYSASEDKIRKLQDELLSTAPEGGSSVVAPAKLSVHKVDISSVADIERLFEEIKAEHGRDGPDVLVSNAGYGKRVPKLEDITVEEFDYTLTVNVRAAFVLSKLAIPRMAARGWGRIVFVSSLAAGGGGINGCHYAASKAGLQGLMRSLALKHAHQGITVNDVAPAMIGDTGLVPDEAFVAGTPGDVRNIPVGRLGAPEEVANVVVMFCETGYMTGQSVLLSGGLK